MEALWALLPLCVLLVAALVLFYRYHYRILRDRANAVLSRDRAHVDLQMMVHQAKKQVQTEADGSIASSKSRLPSLPPGPPSSAASETTAPPRMSNAEADRQHYAEVRVPRTAPLMAEQRAPHPKWVEAGRQWFFSETIGVKRSRAAPIAPARLAPATSSGPERVELTELVALAEMADDETVAALHDIVRPRHAGSTSGPAQAWHRRGTGVPPQANQQVQMHAVPMRVKLAKLAELASDDESHETVAAPQAIASPRQPAHCGSMPAQANPQMQTACIVVPVRTVPVQSGTHLTATPLYSSSIPLQQLSGFGAEASDLRFLFARLFTPKHPSTLPRSQWLSYTRLFSMVQPYAPARVWKQGNGNLKQLVIGWCQHHPAYAGLELSEWCMRLKDDDRPVLSGQRQPTVYKFCLECTS